MFLWQNNAPASFQKWAMNSTEYSLRQITPEELLLRENNDPNLFQMWQINTTEYSLYQRHIIYPEIFFVLQCY